MSKSSSSSSVFYADKYHPIQAGSIDGTDIIPHDNAISRALLCSSASLYDPFGDPKATGDPYCTLFVGRLSHLTSEDSLLKAMSKYGHVKNLRLVRHIVTGASRGYAFVEYETEREMRRAYKDAHHSFVDDSEIMVDYCRQLLMPGWIPRRLGGGLGGRKESGQLRFGGRERPFRAPLQQIPYDDLKKLGIPPPPEGKYASRFQVPSPPRKKRGSADDKEDFDRSTLDEQDARNRRSCSVEEHNHKRSHNDRDERHGKRHSVEKRRHQEEDLPQMRTHIAQDEHNRRSSSVEKQYHKRRESNNREERHGKRFSVERRRHQEGSSREDEYPEKSSVDRAIYFDKRNTADEEEVYYKRSSRSWEDSSQKHRMHDHQSDRHSRRRSSSRHHSRDRSSDH